MFYVMIVRERLQNIGNHDITNLQSYDKKRYKIKVQVFF